MLTPNKVLDYYQRGSLSEQKRLMMEERMTVSNNFKKQFTKQGIKTAYDLFVAVPNPMQFPAAVLSEETDDAQFAEIAKTMQEVYHLELTNDDKNRYTQSSVNLYNALQKNEFGQLYLSIKQHFGDEIGKFIVDSVFKSNGQLNCIVEFFRFDGHLCSDVNKINSTINALRGSQSVDAMTAFQTNLLPFLEHINSMGFQASVLNTLVTNSEIHSNTDLLSIRKAFHNDIYNQLDASNIQTLTSAGTSISMSAHDTIARSLKDDGLTSHSTISDIGKLKKEYYNLASEKEIEKR